MPIQPIAFKNNTISNSLSAEKPKLYGVSAQAGLIVPPPLTTAQINRQNLTPSKPKLHGLLIFGIITATAAAAVLLAKHRYSKKEVKMASELIRDNDTKFIKTTETATENKKYTPSTYTKKTGGYDYKSDNDYISQVIILDNQEQHGWGHNFETFTNDVDIDGGDFGDFGDF